MALYTDTVMDHFLHPRNVGEIADADGVGEVGNAKCGDIMKMYLKIDNGIITDETTGATFQAQPFPPFLQEIITDGGLVARWQKKLGTK